MVQVQVGELTLGEVVLQMVVLVVTQERGHEFVMGLAARQHVLVLGQGRVWGYEWWTRESGKAALR
jgi:hypothetical protein